MLASYLVRFDDICPTMKWSVWDRIEAILQEHGVRPMLGVIPDNQDASLRVDPPNPAFWDRVRQWQLWGWTIGLHGYQHLYTSQSAGLVGIKKASEFAGVPLREQRTRLLEGFRILNDEGVRPRVWIAPGHSFDQTTVTILKDIGISCISDGLFVWPRTDRGGSLWIPQQLWRFRALPFGVWTVCLHHSVWTERQLDNFGRDIRRFSNRITGFEDVLAKYQDRRRQAVDGLIPGLMRRMIARKSA